jgi:hypothetical protein
MQLTAEQIQIPDEVFQALKGKVFRTRTQRKVVFSVTIGQVFNYHPTTGRRIAPFSGPKVIAKLSPVSTQAIGEYGLNAIRSIIHDQNFVYEGQAESGEFIFYKKEVNFLLNGNLHHIPAAMKLLRVNGNTAEIEDVLDPAEYTYTYTVNRVKTTVNYSKEEVAEMIGVTPETLDELVYTKWTANSPDPQQNITSSFSLIRKEGQGYVTDLYINEEKTDPATYGQKFTHYGKKTTVRLNYVVYNDCTPATADASAGFEKGNFGTCAIAKNHSFSDPYTPSVDLDREFAILEARVCEQPETGKEYRISGHYNLKTEENIPGLIRKTGEGVVFI